MEGDQRIVCREDDKIEILGFSVRVHNALRRANVDTIGKLIKIQADGGLFNVRNFGEKSVAQVAEKLIDVTLVTPASTPQSQPIAVFSTKSDLPIVDLDPPQVPIHEVIKWQQTFIAKQLRTGLIHPNVVVDDRTLSKLVQTNSVYDKDMYTSLVYILTSPVSVSDELESLMSSRASREIEILRRRHGFSRQTLQEIAKVFDVSRERVRQIEKQAYSHIEQAMISLPLLRIRSAILFANDEDFEMSYEDWSHRLLKTGLLGDWTDKRYSGFDQIELMMAICKLTHDTNNAIHIPQCLDYMLQLHQEGQSSTSAKVMLLAKRLSTEAKRLIRRHLHHSGAISLDWLVHQAEIPFSKAELQEIFEAEGYYEVGDNWYMSTSLEYMPHSLHKSHVFHKSLLKMFLYCGPLDVRDIYFGIEHTLIKTDFPIPPSDVLATIIENYGYLTEDDLWYWDGMIAEELNTGEQIILKTINANNGVAHHSELAQAIVRSPLSLANLHATLSRSPLYDNFERSLYKLRGSQSSYEAIEHARSAAARIPTELEVKRDSYGHIIIETNLGTLTIGNGTILSEKLPKLSGSWQYICNDGTIRDITVMEKEIRGLLRVFQEANCQVGDRIQLKFNTWHRKVSASKLESIG